MMFYELIFLRQFPMKLLGLPTTKHFFSFILGCPQDFNFARSFCPFSPVLTQPYQNGQATLNSYRHFTVKLKYILWLGDLKASFSNSSEKSIYNTPSSWKTTWNPFSMPYLKKAMTLEINAQKWLHSWLHFVDICSMSAFLMISSLGSVLAWGLFLEWQDKIYKYIIVLCVDIVIY